MILSKGVTELKYFLGLNLRSGCKFEGTRYRLNRRFPYFRTADRIPPVALSSCFLPGQGIRRENRAAHPDPLSEIRLRLKAPTRNQSGRDRLEYVDRLGKAAYEATGVFGSDAWKFTTPESSEIGTTCQCGSCH
jgi:hypothetical protein